MVLNTWHGQACDVIKLEQALVAATLPGIRRELDFLVKECNETVLIDMSSVKELDSSGIAALVYMYRRLRLEKREMALLGVHGKPDELIRLLRVDHSIQRYNHYDEYLARH